MRIVIVTLLILFASSIAFVWFMNPERITVTLWPDRPEYAYEDTPLGLVIFTSVGVGAVFAAFIAVLEGSKIRLSNTRLRAQVKRLQREVELLRRPSIDLSELTALPTEAAGVGASASGGEANEILDSE